MSLRKAMQSINETVGVTEETELTNEQKVAALVDYFGYTKDQAEAMLVDMGQIEPGWCEG